MLGLVVNTIFTIIAFFIVGALVGAGLLGKMPLAAGLLAAAGAAYVAFRYAQMTWRRYWRPYLKGR